MNWEIVESLGTSPAEVMKKDFEMLQQLDPNGKAILHFYEWDPCLTYGYFIEPSHHIVLDRLNSYCLQGVKRPTGGGIIFHLSDFAFSILIPSKYCFLNPLDNYCMINRKIAEAIDELSDKEMNSYLYQKSSCLNLKQSTAVSSLNKKQPFCMAEATPFDIFANGKKIGGSAQRRTKGGLLHQGSISLFPPPWEIIKNVLKNGKEIVLEMKKNSAFLFSDKKAFNREKMKEVLNSTLYNF